MQSVQTKEKSQSAPLRELVPLTMLPVWGDTVVYEPEPLHMTGLQDLNTGRTPTGPLRCEYMGLDTRHVPRPVLSALSGKARPLSTKDFLILRVLPGQNDGLAGKSAFWMRDYLYYESSQAYANKLHYRSEKNEFEGSVFFSVHSSFVKRESISSSIDEVNHWE